MRRVWSLSVGVPDVTGAGASPADGAGFRAGWTGAIRLLRPPLRTLIAGQGLGQFADGLALVAFAQLVIFDIGQGATPAHIASVLAVTLLPFSVVGPLAGVFIDRWDRRRTLVVTSLCRAGLAICAVGIAVVRSEPLAYVGVLLLLSSEPLPCAARDPDGQPRKTRGRREADGHFA